MATILLVDDEATIHAIVTDALERMGHTTVAAQSVAEALKALAGQPVDLIISDFVMPGLSGLDLLELIRQDGNEVPMILLTGQGSIEHAVTSIKAGVIDYITKPVREEQLRIAVSNALELVRLRRENDALREEVLGLRDERIIVGDSPQIQQLLSVISAAAPTRATVLLQGESGTGKELAARAIHNRSDRHDRPFVQINCAAIPDTLVESVLFGHEKGAFTGALKRVEGAFERAHTGTLLLDEISEMRIDLQAKLLRVLQEQEFERVGGTQPIRVDVRIVATTNRDLGREVAEGRFRQDLFYRLSVIPIQIPPLRDRKRDIPLLAHRFATRTATELGRPFEGLAPEAVALLTSYDWPGNVRELQHAIERAVILSGEALLRAQHFDAVRMGLAPGATGPSPARAPTPIAATASVPAVPDGGIVLPTLDVNEAERLLIANALERTGGNRTRAAQLLNMSVRTLRQKLNTPN